jgi:hypothetical protein
MTTNNSFMPAGYEIPQGESNYLKFQQGENKFRILSQPVIGWLDWDDKKPLRFPISQKPKPIIAEKAVKHFWAMIVWNYNKSAIQILEITQGGIQKSVKALADDAEWGNPFGYDIKVTKTGEKMDTEYKVNPSPHKPVSAEILKAYKEKPCYLGALFQGADPFIDHGQVTPLNDLF